MGAQCEVLIIGGGVIGLTTAYFLAKDGVHVTMVDRGEFGQESSWAGAGIVSDGNFEHAKSGFDKLRALSARVFPSLSAELRDETGIDNGYILCGGIELESGVDEATIQAWQEEGISFARFSRDELFAHEIAFEPPEAGYYLPGMAQVRNPRHVRALVAACRLRGVDLIPRCAIEELEVNADKVTAVVCQNERRTADRFLLCAGAWSDQLLKAFGCKLHIHPVRGQSSCSTRSNLCFIRSLCKARII